MFKRPLPPVVILGLGLLVLAIVAATRLSTFSSANTAAPKPELIVHEWGTFTSVTGQNGSTLIWRPLTVESDLPSFVYSVDEGGTWRGRGLRYPSKSGLAVRVRMETPVLYFYSKEETSVAVNVGFPTGRITEWYPTAQLRNGTIDGLSA